MAKKKVKSDSNKLSRHESNIKAILSLLVLLLAFAVLLIFNTYQENIIYASFKWFISLAVVLFAFLLALLFLINPQKKH
ncbi:MAG: hypothetical protein CO135_01015 [Candidatus Levybacteria bacterium CG_4_9_14_3_um_filter_35_16]|nr:MAG: hypothetical protein COW87_03555 [Candidatus Levybacteria bacterium CG22_combo_CG10-13_8_21_14_all_35_11]PJA91483.1 MAG: hypothetical protein CO135_01015 [Candidatus Levybacteria bacterium CG_4_9_14_3_um_filter_35_16]PJC54478.1 MAG: hypothetical protein CO028_02285 [Candidatus Levybacteria bacterium CG_4_9_14_0_2_um_filter_35_21]